MNKILIVHPEGNLNGNPNLYGLVKIISENGWSVEIISRRSPTGNQDTDIDNVKFILLDSFDKKNIYKHLMARQIIFATMKEKPALIIGVDEGIIEASYYANRFSIPLGLISYEIKYTDEIVKSFKKREINASKNLDFVVVQDKIRAHELLRENKIKNVKIFLIPVAGVRITDSQKQRYIHEKYNIAGHMKIALSIGSVCDWSCSGELIESVNHWPDDWILFLHSRDNSNHFITNYVSIHGKLNSKIIVSNECINNIEDIGGIVSSADIGLVFYRATYFDFSCGNNIKYIGMSSGKAATYLKYGLPLAVFGNSFYEEYVDIYGIGIRVADPSKFIPVTLDNKASSRCAVFFDKYLDLNVTSAEFIKYIEEFRVNT